MRFSTPYTPKMGFAFFWCETAAVWFDTAPWGGVHGRREHPIVHTRNADSRVLLIPQRTKLAVKIVDNRCPGSAGGNCNRHNGAAHVQHRPHLDVAPAALPGRQGRFRCQGRHRTERKNVLALIVCIVDGDRFVCARVWRHKTAVLFNLLFGF